MPASPPSSLPFIRHSPLVSQGSLRFGRWRLFRLGLPLPPLWIEVSLVTEPCPLPRLNAHIGNTPAPDTSWILSPRHMFFIFSKWNPSFWNYFLGYLVSSFFRVSENQLISKLACSSLIQLLSGAGIALSCSTTFAGFSCSDVVRRANSEVF